MNTHNIGFSEEISKIISELSSNKHLICSSGDRDAQVRGLSETQSAAPCVLDKFLTDITE